MGATRRGVLGGSALALVLLAPAGSWAAGANASDDTHISSTAPAGNFGAAAAVNIGGGNTGLIRFDLSGLPAGLGAANINKATMTFYVNAVMSAGAVDVAQVTSAWTESGVSGGNRPAYLPPFLTDVVTANARKFVTVDVTQLVRDWVSGTAANHGVQISAAASAPGTAIALDSKENLTTSHPAFLDVVIQAVGPAGPTGPQGIPGVAGPAGPTGPTGPTGPNYGDNWVFGSVSVPAGSILFIDAECGTGQIALSGTCGYIPADAHGITMHPIYSGPELTNHRQWRCAIYNSDTSARAVTYGAFCVVPGSGGAPAAAAASSPAFVSISK